MEFNALLAGIVIATFFGGYYVGWYTRGWWEEKKHLFGKNLKEREKKKK